MKILIIKFRNIGDVLLTGPLASTLKNLSPDNHISVLVKPGTEAILQHHPHIDEVLISPKRRKGESQLQFLRREMAWLKQLRQEHFDLVINTTEGDHGTLIGFFAKIKQRIGAGKIGRDKWWRTAMLTEVRPSRPGKRHTVIRNLELLPDRQVEQYRQVHLGFSDTDLAHVKDLLEQEGWQQNSSLVQVHPTSRWFFKCWNDQAMAKLIDLLQTQYQQQVVLTSGPDQRELDKIKDILALCQSKPLNLGGQMSLPQTAALSSLCRLFIGVDTAPMHMAAAMNVPVIALFGPSGAFDWGPWPNGWPGEETPYPKQNGIQQCGPHTVIQKEWACVPCGQDGCNGSKSSRCLEQISVAEIIPHIKQKLDIKEAQEKSAEFPTFNNASSETDEPLSASATLINRAVRYYLHHSPITEGKSRLLKTFKPLIKPKAEQVVTDIKHGFKMMVNLRNPEHERLYFYQDHDERYEVNILKEVIKAGDTCWDVGANIGFYTCLLARQVMPQGQVISFEPSSSTMRYLAANVAINCLDNVTLIQKAAGDNPGSSELSGGSPDIGEGTASLKSSEHGYSETVEVDTIDRMYQNLPTPDFIKIDVEGFELEVLKGAQQFLSQHHPIIMMEVRTRNLDEKQQIEQLLSDCGYAFYEFHKHDLELHQHLSSIRRRNVLLVKPSSPHFQRISSLLGTQQQHEKTA